MAKQMLMSKKLCRKVTLAELQSASEERSLCSTGANLWLAFWKNKMWKEQYLDLVSRSKSVEFIASSLQNDLFKERQQEMTDSIAQQKREALMSSSDEEDDDDDDDECDDDDDSYDTAQEEADFETYKNSAKLVCRLIDGLVVEHQDLLHMSGNPMQKFVKDYMKHRKRIFSRKAADLTFEDFDILLRFNLKLEGMLEMCQNWVTANDQLQFQAAVLCLNSLTIAYQYLWPYVEPHIVAGNRTLV